MTHSGTQLLPTPIHRRRGGNLTGHGLPRRPASCLSFCLTHSPPSATVHQRPPRSRAGRSRTVADAGEHWPTLLESVLGATPQEFESPILRRADLQQHR